MFFITFRLHGTLPIRSGRDGRSFVAADSELERALAGPTWLSDPVVAECFLCTLREGEQVRGWYDLVVFARDKFYDALVGSILGAPTFAPAGGFISSTMLAKMTAITPCFQASFSIITSDRCIKS